MRPNPSVMVVESSLSLLVKTSIEQQQNQQCGNTAHGLITSIFLYVNYDNFYFSNFYGFIIPEPYSSYASMF